MHSVSGQVCTQVSRPRCPYSVAFSFLGRDFYNALSEKDVERFYKQIVKWLVALSLGIPVFVLRDYYLSLLQLEWREWMTTRLTRDYLSNQAFYRMQTDVLIDNPDQRISSDIRCRLPIPACWRPMGRLAAACADRQPAFLKGYIACP